ncbi:hypothetical protein [Desulfotomaculum copahuensis]|uniref:Uncharacterized protein n=1 Tax=Desulfotomaculum copahuensis TaxID=1838280 RepID=A0A1B7LG04_9FIRM|nr:hypothetical protein [Desulfotomaculum copahuensis]OAT83631.1 hypothetical protein A6M21_08085 [Desulfotomaculum copahuensis]
MYKKSADYLQRLMDLMEQKSNEAGVDKDAFLRGAYRQILTSAIEQLNQGRLPGVFFGGDR